MVLCSCFARRVKDVCDEDSCVKTTSFYCAWGCFRVFVWPPSTLAAQEARDRDLFPDIGRCKRIGAIESLDVATARCLDQEQAADHGRAVVGDERPRHHDLDAEARGVAQESLVSVVIGEPGR